MRFHPVLLSAAQPPAVGCAACFLGCSWSVVPRLLLAWLKFLRHVCVQSAELCLLPHPSCCSLWALTHFWACVPQWHVRRAVTSKGVPATVQGW